LVEAREEEEGSVSPKMAAVKLVGTSRDRQAEVRVARVRRSRFGRERSVRGECVWRVGWVGLIDPDPALLGQ
jgi:hypothetical protein